jgi:hypothetical protein
MEREPRYASAWTKTQIDREEHFDSEGRLRPFWVLRGEDEGILLMTKTWNDMVVELMLTYEINNKV